jgi:hypothetical protein
MQVKTQPASMGLPATSDCSCSSGKSSYDPRASTTTWHTCELCSMKMTKTLAAYVAGCYPPLFFFSFSFRPSTIRHDHTCITHEGSNYRHRYAYRVASSQYDQEVAVTPKRQISVQLRMMMPSIPSRPHPLPPTWRAVFLERYCLKLSQTVNLILRVLSMVSFCFLCEYLFVKSNAN